MCEGELWTYPILLSITWHGTKWSGLNRPVKTITMYISSNNALVNVLAPTCEEHENSTRTHQANNSVSKIRHPTRRWNHAMSVRILLHHRFNLDTESRIDFCFAASVLFRLIFSLYIFCCCHLQLTIYNQQVAKEYTSQVSRSMMLVKSNVYFQ